MQMFRKAAVATVILGAGLASTAGVAMAHEHADAAKSCSNVVGAKNSNGAGKTLGDTTGGNQDITPSNTCDIMNGNVMDSGNNMAGGNLVNGDTKTVNDSTTTSSTSSILTQLVPAA